MWDGHPIEVTLMVSNILLIDRSSDALSRCAETGPLRPPHLLEHLEAHVVALDLAVLVV